MTPKITAVFKTHFDIGFTELSSELIGSYGTGMLDKVLEVCEGTQDSKQGLRYVWTMPAWPLLQMLKHTTPDRLLRAEKLIEGGQLLCHALPFTMHTELLSVEELIYGFKYAKEFCDKYNKPYPVSAKMTDVPGHSLILPSVLASAGVKFLHLGCNPASLPPDVPRLFWWEGKDGSRVLTFYSKGGYGSTLLPPPDWKYKAWLAMLQTNDNIGPHDSGIVGQLLNQINESGVSCDFKIGSMDDFYYDIIQEDLSDLPVVYGDLGDTWIHGAGTYPIETALLRHSRREITALEKLAAYMSFNGVTLPKIQTDDYYDNAILFCEHTWGLDVKSHLGWGRAYDKQGFNSQKSEPRYINMEQSWDEQRERANKAAKASDLLKKDLQNHFCGQNKYISIFNPSGKVFKGCVDIGEIKGLKNIPVINGVRNFACVELEPFSLTPFEIMQKNECTVPENKAFSLSIENDDIMINDIKNGTKIKSAYQYSVIGTQRMTDFLKDYLYRIYDWAIADFGRQNYPEIQDEYFIWKPVNVAQKGASTVVSLSATNKKSCTEFGDAENIEIIYTLLTDGVHIELRLHNKQATPFIEAGYLVFDINKAPKHICVNKSGLVLNPQKDICKDANNLMFAVDKFISVDNLRIESQTCPLVSFGKDGIYRFNGGTFKKPDNGDIFFNLFNNMWGTNFPQWMSGDLNFEFYLGNVESEKEEPPILLEGAFTANITENILKCHNCHILAIHGNTMRIQNDSSKAIIKGSLLRNKQVIFADLFGRILSSEKIQEDSLTIKAHAGKISTLILSGY